MENTNTRNLTENEIGMLCEGCGEDTQRLAEMVRNDSALCSRCALAAQAAQRACFSVPTDELHSTTIGITSPEQHAKLIEPKAAAIRNPQIIAGAIRQQVESLANIVNTERLQALCDELDQSLTVQQLTASLKTKQGWAR